MPPAPHDPAPHALPPIAFRPRKPGLFVTATDTGVGKTVAACAIARAWMQQGLRVGVCKPIASGCRLGADGQLLSDDALALQHFAGGDLPLQWVNPVRYRQPLAPAAAAEEEGREVDWPAVGRALAALEERCDVMLVEGIGGLLAPLGGPWTVLDLAKALGYPVLVVTRPGLGTLNHTAMTVQLLRQGGCQVAGLVVNGMPSQAAQELDPSLASNCRWLTRMTGVPILAVLPKAEEEVAPERGSIPTAILAAAQGGHWSVVTGSLTGGSPPSG